MKALAIKVVAVILSMLISGIFMGCTNAGAANGVDAGATSGVDSSGPIAPFRVTRGVLPQNSKIQQADGLCSSEFGNVYTTASREEIDGLTKINGLQVFQYAFDRSLGKYNEGCPDTYCVVVCIRK